jgi:hypothetical protein
MTDYTAAPYPPPTTSARCVVSTLLSTMVSSPGRSDQSRHRLRRRYRASNRALRARFHFRSMRRLKPVSTSSDEMQAQTGSLHVSMAGAHRLDAAEYEIHFGRAGVVNALPQQRDVETVPAERRSRGGVREIADAIVHIESRRGRRPAVHARQVERPARLIAPRANIGLELSVVLLREPPSRHIGFKVALHRICRTDPLDVYIFVRGHGKIGAKRGTPIGKIRARPALVPIQCRTCPAPIRTSASLRVRGTSPRGVRSAARGPTTRVNEGRNRDTSATADSSIQR